MGRPGARTITIRGQILSVLRAEWPLPISTRRVCELLGAHRYDETGHRVYPQLRALDRIGLIECIRREPDCRDVFWRFLGDPSDDDLNAAVEATESPAISVLTPAEIAHPVVVVGASARDVGRGRDTRREVPRAAAVSDLLAVIASLRAAAIASADTALAEAETRCAAAEAHLASVKSMRAAILSYDQALTALTALAGTPWAWEGRMGAGRPESGVIERPGAAVT